jgi:hypothetical protein
VCGDIPPDFLIRSHSVVLVGAFRFAHLKFIAVGQLGEGRLIGIGESERVNDVRPSTRNWKG